MRRVSKPHFMFHELLQSIYCLIGNEREFITTSLHWESLIECKTSMRYLNHFFSLVQALSVVLYQGV